MPLILSLLGLGLTVVAWLAYLVTIPKEKVPVRPIPHLAAMVLGVALAGLAIVLATALTGVLIAGVVTLSLAGLFFYLLSVARLPDGELVVSLGDPLPSFQLVNDNGETIESDQWRGQRVLLKFFRGYW